MPDLTRLRQAVDASGEVIFMTDREGVFTFVNLQFERFYGHTAADVIGHATPRILKGGEVSLDHYVAFWERLRLGESASGEFVNRTKDGRVVNVEWTVSPIWDAAHEIVGYLAIQRDITARKRAEEELQFQQAVLHTERELTLDGILVVDDHAKVLSFNGRFAEMWGVSADVIGTRADEVLLRAVTPALSEPDRFMDTVRHLWEHHDEVSRDEVDLKDGRTFDRYSAPMRAADGRHYGRVWYFRDVTEGKVAERALRERDRRWQAAMASTDLAVFTQNRDLRYTWLHNPQVGVLPADALGKTDAELLPREVAETLTRLKRRALEGGEHVREEVSATVQGHLRFFEFIVEPLRSPSGVIEGITGASLDTTSHRHLENQLRQAQKMEAIGSLAGGIAHDFNNLLTAIIGYAELAMTQVDAGSPIRQDLDEIRRAGRSAEALTRQLLIFSRKSIVRPVLLSLNEVVTRVEKILRRVVGEHVEFDVRLSADLGVVRADAGQLEQVLMNLVVNARDAMPMGGTLTIETSHATVTEAFARAHGGSALGIFDSLAIADTGSGMTAEVQAQIFDPFFTTKGPEKGTGLGLATVHGIVQQSGGYITVTSAPGQGSTFTIYLPRVADEAGDVIGGADAIAIAKGTETILFVEDNDSIRTMAVRALRQFGYDVLAAQSAADAIAITQRSDRPIDLLVTDVVMPGMNGRALAERLRKPQPGLKVIFTSGFTDDSDLLHGIRLADTPFVQKPYTIQLLARTIRDVLDRT